MRRHGRWRIWCRIWPSKLNRTKQPIIYLALVAVLGIFAIACGAAEDEVSETETRNRGNCVWYHDDPTSRTEAAVRSSLSDVIDSPIADQIGLIETADLAAVCEESAAVADFPIEVTDGRQAAMASEMMVDLLDSCVAFYASPDAPLAYRIAITFIDMLWMLEQDAPRWPRRNVWGVREWCDSIVEGAVAS